MRKIAIVIVNYKSEEFLKNCLIAVEKSRHNNYMLEKIIVVNNDIDVVLNYNDYSISGDKLSIINMPKNIGFGAGCNISVKDIERDVDFILFLNPDVEVSETAIDIAVESLINNSEIGVSGGKIKNYSNNPSYTCEPVREFKQFLIEGIGLFRLLKYMHKDYHQWHKNAFVGHVIGAFYLIRKSVFDQLNGFDERYFVYYEDMDLSRRVGDLGYKLLHNANCEIMHVGGGSSSKVKAYRMYYAYTSAEKYIDKFYGVYKASIYKYMVKLLFLPLRIIKALFMCDMKSVKESLKVYILLKSKD